ncbi:MAG: dimethylsulfonioproprionate lyase family protein [Pseudomonadota bacterium]
MSAFAPLYETATALVAATPALRDFSPWPASPAVQARTPVQVPGVAHLLQTTWDVGSTLSPEHTRLHTALIDAIYATTEHAEWRRTYTEAEVGADFMARYGYYELLGPTGHFHSDTTRAYIGYWGPGLHYPWHEHRAEEIYYALAGGATFEVADDRYPKGVGESHTHASGERHAMTTDPNGAGFLTLAVWRGAGLGENATMSSAA